jgi:hypothetical protein
MGNNNSMIILMFEEIKGLLVSIDKKLIESDVVKERLSAQESTTRPKSEDKINTVSPLLIF